MEDESNAEPKYQRNLRLQLVPLLAELADGEGRCSRGWTRRSSDAELRGWLGRRGRPPRPTACGRAA